MGMEPSWAPCSSRDATRASPTEAPRPAGSNRRSWQWLPARRAGQRCTSLVPGERRLASRWVCTYHADGRWLRRRKRYPWGPDTNRCSSCASRPHAAPGQAASVRFRSRSVQQTENNGTCGSQLMSCHRRTLAGLSDWAGRRRIVGPGQRQHEILRQMTDRERRGDHRGEAGPTRSRPDTIVVRPCRVVRQGGGASTVTVQHACTGAGPRPGGSAL